MDALLITDGECEFCQRSAVKLARIVPSGWVNLPSTSLTETFGLSVEQLARSVWLVEFTDDGFETLSGAKAIGKVLRMRGGFWSWVGWHAFIPPASWICAGLYRYVANNRKFFAWLMKPSKSL